MRVGIDLGTTYSTIAYYDEQTGKPVVVKNKYGHVGTPSVLCFNEDGTIVYGEEAKELQEFGEANTIAYYKRDMGNKDFCPSFYGKQYDAEKLSGIFLKQFIGDVSNELGTRITEAVITVPAYFDNYQREATIRAGEAAGVKVLRIINEPTAAAIAFGLDRLEGNNTYLVYDLGGGTFDVTIVNISANGIKVIGTDGDHKLGGKDWDDQLANYIADKFNDEYGYNILEESEAFYELLVKCEKAKKELSTKASTFVSVSADGEKAKYIITVDDFNVITESLMEQTRQLCEGLLGRCNMRWSDIDGVLLVGGSTRMKMVHDFVTAMSGKDPIHGVNVDEAVAVGAAIQAQIDAHANDQFVYTIGGKNAGLPTLGAANIIDVTAHALGCLQIRADRSGFKNEIVIPENSQIPCAMTKPTLITPRNCKNGETEVYVLQGSSEYPFETVVLEKHVVSGIELKGKKDTIVNITYHYDKNGTVQVEAVQADTNKTLAVRSEPLPDDISWMGKSLDELESMVVARPVTVAICIDTSGSMSGSLGEAKKAAKKLVSSLDLNITRVALISFETTVHTVLKPTKEKFAINMAIDSLSIGGGTEQPLSMAYNMLQNFESDRYIVVLTDGSWSNSNVALNVSNLCRQEGIEIMAIGIGSVNEGFLKQISTVDGMDVLTDVHSMVSAFGNIGQEIASRSSIGLRGFWS